MAEILGAVASGLAVAEVGLKIGGTVWKLRRLWQQVHEVPETIQDLMRQIEMMDPILSDHEANLGIQSTALLGQLPVYNAASAMPGASYCREALGDLRRLVDDLDGAVESEKRSRRTVARMRVVLKKDTIKGFQDRLERAMRLLQWSQVNYLAANATAMGAMLTDMWTSMTDIQSQQNLVLQQLSNNNASISTGSSPFPVIIQHDGTSPEHTIDKQGIVQRQRQGNSIHIPWSGPSIFGAIVIRRSKANSDSQATYAARIQLPKWLSQKFWDISLNRACSGWQGSLTTWNVVPEDSPGMLCVKMGDLDGLLHLFNRGLASPQDCDVDGCTIFNVCLIDTPSSMMGIEVDQIKIACLYSRTHIVSHFINMNLDITYRMAMDDITVLVILGGNLPITIIRQLSSRGSFPSLDNAAEDVELNSGFRWRGRELIIAFGLSIATRREELFELYMRTYLPFLDDLSPSWKHYILTITIDHGRLTADGFRRIICLDGPIRPVDTKTWNDDGVSLLHLIFVLYLQHGLNADAEEFKPLLEEVIEATNDMHRKFHSTPLSRLISFQEAYSALQGAVMPLHCFGLHWLRFRFQKKTVRGRLEEMTEALQSLVSVIARCGYDLLEFGRQEAATWVGQCSADSIAGNALYVGLRYDEVFEVRAVHYGAEPRDWYFVLDHHYEEYAGAFWNVIENPHLFMVPGAWVD